MATGWRPASGAAIATSGMIKVLWSNRLWCFITTSCPFNDFQRIYCMSGCFLKCVQLFWSQQFEETNFHVFFCFSPRPAHFLRRIPQHDSWLQPYISRCWAALGPGWISFRSWTSKIACNGNGTRWSSRCRFTTIWIMWHFVPLKGARYVAVITVYKLLNYTCYTEICG